MPRTGYRNWLLHAGVYPGTISIVGEFSSHQRNAEPTRTTSDFIELLWLLSATVSVRTENRPSSRQLSACGIQHTLARLLT
jgi:hypothetical protein